MRWLPITQEPRCSHSFLVMGYEEKKVGYERIGMHSVVAMLEDYGLVALKAEQLMPLHHAPVNQAALRERILTRNRSRIRASCQVSAVSFWIGLADQEPDSAALQSQQTHRSSRA
jgi:hypothetical protein